MRNFLDHHPQILSHNLFSQPPQQIVDPGHSFCIRHSVDPYDFDPCIASPALCAVAERFLYSVTDKNLMTSVLRIEHVNKLQDGDCMYQCSHNLLSSAFKRLCFKEF